MTSEDDDRARFSLDRRNVLAATGGALMVSTLSAIWPASLRSKDLPVIRWGIVGTGSIARSMAAVIQRVPNAELAAVSSRRMDSAKAFATKHNAGRAFDDWRTLAGFDGIDAVYVATPTGVREEISVFAASRRKHVLAEKPFASLDSVQRIVDACRENEVGFMDGTHFGHHPRTAAIRATMEDSVGWPWALNTTFQFGLEDRRNIRFNPTLEPMGAVGDVGWYAMRATAEYLSPALQIDDLAGYLRRDPDSGAAVGGGGIIRFSDGSTSSWNCGFDSGAVMTELRLSGAKGVIAMDDFPSNSADGSAAYRHYRGNFDTTRPESIRIESPFSSRELMFQDFAAMTTSKPMQERSIADTERTQALLDAIWENALQNESEIGSPI